MIVRAATSADAAAIHAVHVAAFPTDAEARLVDALIGDGDQLVSVVADDGVAIIGQCLFSRMTVVAERASIPATALAPVAVRPLHQRQGVGTAMIQAGLATLEEAGIGLCFVLGDPAYYRRFGFSASAARPFASPYAGSYFQARWTGVPVPAEVGTAVHAPAFARLDA